MRFNDRWRTSSAYHRLCCLLLAAAVLDAACSKSSNPSGPDPLQMSFLGTWTGEVTSEVIGKGTATVTFNQQLDSPTVPLVSGVGTLIFPEPGFSLTGRVSASPDVNATVLVVLFERGVVPCPREPGGVAQRTIAANLTITSNRLHGNYLAGGCPGGTMDLVRK